MVKDNSFGHLSNFLRDSDRRIDTTPKVNKYAVVEEITVMEPDTYGGHTQLKFDKITYFKDEKEFLDWYEWSRQGKHITKMFTYEEIQIEPTYTVKIKS